MKKYKVIVDYQVRCSARGNVYVEANCEEDAMDMAEELVNEIDNTDLDEVEIIGDVEAVDVEEL